MPIYSYTARDKKGKTIKGETAATSEKQLAHTLREEGLLLTHWERKKKKGSLMKKLSSIGSASRKEKILFTNHLAMMLKAGVPVSKALGILAQQAKTKSFRRILEQVQTDVQKGKSLTDSLATHPNIFPKMYTSMVMVGEHSGRLEDVLVQLSNQLQKDHLLISRIRGAMTYPSIVLLAMIGVGIVMVTMVLPQLSDVFAEMEADLPFLTKLLLNSGDFASANIILVGATSIAVIAALFLFAKSKIGKPIWHKILILFPLIGPLAKKVNLARFARTISSLLKSGVSMVTALDIVSQTLGNVHYQRATGEAGSEITKGISLVTIFEREGKLFPPMVTQMIAIGEETGELDSILLQLAEFYEEEIKQTTDNLSSIIEPLLMIAMGLAVGFLAISVVQPIYSIGSSF